ncbi:MAG: hypothetical protein V1875_03305 [Candidatus Altiarchaeota archaeon]
MDRKAAIIISLIAAVVLLFAVAVAVIGVYIIHPAIFFPDTHPPGDEMAECGEDYGCVYESMSEGRPSRIVISEEVPSLSIFEKSEIVVEPKNGAYDLTFRILELRQMEKPKAASKSMTGSISKDCPNIVNSLDTVRSTSAVCTAPGIDEAKSLIIDGLNEAAIKRYRCRGTLIEQIQKVCAGHAFPPGVKKPAVYLYPVEKASISVHINVNGFITQSLPAYADGWEVSAEPSGRIDGRYDYLYYEAQLRRLDVPAGGWIVEYGDLDAWFDANLPRLGLNKKETAQFKDYWLEELPKSEYYEIRVLDDEFLEENMGMAISPKPDTVIRLIFHFKPVKEGGILPAPKTATPERKGFTVVEWGGVLDDRAT